MRLRSAAVLVTALLTASVARADEPAVEAPRRNIYLGATAGAIILGELGWGEVALEGSVRLPVWLLWAHGKVLTGAHSTERQDYAYVGAMAGIELRTSGRWLRAVVGLDVGGIRERHSDEGDLVGTETRVVGAYQVAGELGDRVVLRFGLVAAAKDLAPLPTLGLGFRF